VDDEIRRLTVAVERAWQGRYWVLVRPISRSQEPSEIFHADAVPMLRRVTAHRGDAREAVWALPVVTIEELEHRFRGQDLVRQLWFCAWDRVNARQCLLPSTGLRIERVSDGWPEKDVLPAQRVRPLTVVRCERCDHFLPRVFSSLEELGQGIEGADFQILIAELRWAVNDVRDERAASAFRRALDVHPSAGGGDVMVGRANPSRMHRSGARAGDLVDVTEGGPEETRFRSGTYRARVREVFNDHEMSVYPVELEALVEPGSPNLTLADGDEVRLVRP